MSSGGAYHLVTSSAPISGLRLRIEEALQPLRPALRRLERWGDRTFPPHGRARRGCRWLNTGPGWAVGLGVAIFVFLGLASLAAVRDPRGDVLRFVDPLIGTSNGGHVFAGATYPYGMAKAVADSQLERMGGFSSEGSGITGFSHLHDSGTGGSPSMGNFPLFLHRSCPKNDLTECPFWYEQRATQYIPKSVNATPGYFTIDLVNGIRAEMTVSFHAALYRFSFLPNNHTLNPVITVDTSDLPRSGGLRHIWVDKNNGRMVGNGSFGPSFGIGGYDAFFCADFKGAEIDQAGLIARNYSSQLSYGFDVVPNPPWNESSDYGTYVRFKNVKQSDQILARVGLSWLSIDQACRNAENEISDWNFFRLRKLAEAAWRQKLQSVSLVPGEGVNSTHLTAFWSAIYRTYINPQDYTGENQLWNSSEPYFDSYYCIWDTFRGVHPFYVLADPEGQSRMVRSLLDVYKHEGWMPDCRMSFCKGYTQGGSNADVVIVDSFIKGVQGVNWTMAYEAIVKDAEVQPDRWDVEGRGHLEAWKTVGYIPYNGDTEGTGLITRSVSRTTEYAYNDFCIAEMAKALGKEDDAKKYAQRANNWRNLYKEDMRSMGFKGFLQPRFENGTWHFQNATECSNLNNFDGCYLNPSGHETYEGSPWLYTFDVRQDIAALIKLFGGPKAFIKKLDKLHDSGVLYMGDEQAFLLVYYYHYVGRPGLSAKRSHYYIPSIFHIGTGGIPGNDDSGSMGMYVLFNMLGLFPNAGQSVYLISPPYFKEVSIKNPVTGKKATIRNKNFDPTYKNIFIQSAKLNGRPYTKNWIDHSFFAKGGTLELVLGPKESDWGTRKEDLPPSLSTGFYLPEWNIT